MEPGIVTFEGFEFSPHRRRLVRDGRPVRIGSRAFDILGTLVAQAGSVVTKGQLMRAVWPETFVDDNNLRVHMSALRRALDTACGGRPIIENVPGRGYCFVATLDTPPGAAPAKPVARLPVIAEEEQQLLASLIAQLRRGASDGAPDGLMFLDLGSMPAGTSVDQALVSRLAALRRDGTDGEGPPGNRAALLALLAIL